MQLKGVEQQLIIFTNKRPIRSYQKEFRLMIGKKNCKKALFRHNH